MTELNYQCCRHAKEEMGNEKSQGTPKNRTGRVFSSKLIKPNMSFATALRGHKHQKMYRCET
jgi:hypothetical protein